MSIFSFFPKLPNKFAEKCMQFVSFLPKDHRLHPQNVIDRMYTAPSKWRILSKYVAMSLCLWTFGMWEICLVCLMFNCFPSVSRLFQKLF